MLSILTALALQAPAPESTWVETRFHRVHLANGNFIDGQLVEESTRLIVLKMKAGTFGIRRDMIERVEFVRMRSLKETPPPIAAKTAKPRKSEAISAMPEKPVKTPEAAPEPPPASAAPFTPAVMQPVDELLSRYMAFNPEARPETLLPQIRDMGDDAIAYACWRIVNRTALTPIKELIEVLGHQDHPAVLPMLKVVVERGSLDERIALVTPLEARGTSETLALLHVLIGDPSARVWQPATEAVVRLAKANDSRTATDQLIALMTQAGEKSAYAIAIAKIGEPAGRRMLQELALDGEEPAVRAALQGLAVIGNSEDGEIGRRLLLGRSDSLKKAACAFLGQIKYKPAAPELINLLAHPDASVVRDAHWALQNMTGHRYGPEAALWLRWWELSGSKEAEK